MDDYITPLEEPLIQTPEYHRARAVRKCQVVTFVVVLLGIITLGIGLAIPERRFNHGTRLLRATHVINATHVMHMPLDDNASHLVLHDESSPQVMHLPTTHNGTSEQVLFAGSSQHDPRQALLRSKYRGHKLKASSKPWLGRNNPENEDVSLPTVLAYARMASSAYDYIKNTYDGSTGDIARGKGDGYGHATNEGLSHVKAVVYESGEYSCWWWCRFVPDIKSSTKHTANVVVAFKGTTEIGWTMRSDFLTDADMFIYSIATNDTIRLAAENGPHIKRYWLESEAIVETVKRLFPPSPTTILQLSFTGHSLGGVLAGLHAIKNNVLGFGFNSPPGTRVAEILGVDLTGGLGDALGADSNTSNPYSRSSFCTYNTVSDILSNQSPPDVIPILMSNMGGLDLVFLGAQAQRAAAFLRSGAYRPQHQFGRVAPIITAPTLKDPIELHSIVTIVQLLEAFKNGKGQGSDLRCA